MNLKPLQAHIEQSVRTALEEDLGSGDVSAQLIEAEQNASASILCRENAVICGQAWFEQCFRQLDPHTEIDWHIDEGAQVNPGQHICDLRGNARALLSAERSALNFLQTLSATATKTRLYANAVKDTGCKILDTRKTIPGLRLAQKYAVQCGGGYNHRLGLYDAILIKENHINAAGSIAQAVKRAREYHPNLMIEVEIEALSQIEEAITAGAQRLLLDNMSQDQLRQAVAMVQSKVELEASGGVQLQSLREIAETGVDFISIGTLTKDIKAVDLSMRFDFQA